MEFQDKSINCIVDGCGPFVFTAGEQKFFATKGFDNEPKRCLKHRKEKKMQREHQGRP